MTPAQQGALGAVALGALTGLAIAWLVMACTPNLPTRAEQIDEGVWTVMDAKCDAESATRAADDACKDQNRVAACGDGGSFVDAGSACANVRLSNGGKP